MCCILKSTLRLGLIAGIAIGGLSLASPQFRNQIGAGMAQVQATANGVMADVCEDPVMLRRQLAQLAEQYPERIADVQRKLNEVERHLGEIEHDQEVARRVVAMTTSDLQDLKVLVRNAEAERDAGAHNVSFLFDGVRFDLDEAYGEARRISTIRQTYGDRSAANEQQAAFLTEQRERLQEILSRLRTEHETFQSQLWTLDREIAAIKRNEEIIELTEDQAATLESYDKLGRVKSLKQLQAKLDEIRSLQEAQLQTFAEKTRVLNYEDEAMLDMQTDSIDGTYDVDDPFADIEDADEAETKDVALRG